MKKSKIYESTVSGAVAAMPSSLGKISRMYESPPVVAGTLAARACYELASDVHALAMALKAVPATDSSVMAAIKQARKIVQDATPKR